MPRVSEIWFRRFWALAALLVAAFILYESTRTGGEPTAPDLTTTEGYFGHFGLYAALGFCAQTAVLSRRLGVLLAVAAAATAFGGCIELYQSTIPGREASAYDALSDLAGAGAGALVALLLTPRWGRLILNLERPTA